MGKRKRSSKDIDSDTVDKLLKKVKKLVRKRRRISSSSSSDTPAEQSPTHSPQLNMDSDLETQDEIPTIEAPLEGEADVHELAPDILELLGSDPAENKLFGDKIHKDLATRWQHILINGLPKDDKVDLLKQYLPAENCAYMKAPILNPEIKSALSEVHAKRDSYSEQKQNQMSSCIAAIGKALNLALAHTDDIPQEIIKILSDAGRLLCDTHYRESISRRYAIVNVLSKQKREIIKNTKIDDHLFGSNLSEYLKSSKAISQSALELKFRTQRSQQSTSTPRNSGALNARGAPRAPAAEPRVYPGQSRRQPPPPPQAQRDHRRATTSRPRNYPQARRR